MSSSVQNPHISDGNHTQGKRQSLYNCLCHYSFSHLTSCYSLTYSIPAALASLWVCEQVTPKGLLICYPLCLECSSGYPQGTCSLLSLHSIAPSKILCIFSSIHLYLPSLEYKHTELSQYSVHQLGE